MTFSSHHAPWAMWLAMLVETQVQRPKTFVVKPFLFFFFFFQRFYFYFWDRERQSMNEGGAEREGDTESETGSRL